MIFSKVLRLRSLLLALAVLASQPAVFAQSVAMVTDVSGKASLQGGAKPGPVAILTEIPADARMQLEVGARVVVLYTQSGDEYAFTGPSVIQFKGGAPVAVSGAAPQKRTSPIRGTDIRVKPAGTAQAAFVMRSTRTAARILLLSLNGTRTLEANPEFRWQAVEAGVRYQFELLDDTGKLLFEMQTEASSMRLPASLRLREGADYSWEVSARLADGRRYVSSGDFSLASADLRARAESLRPAAGAPVSDRVAYAAWLDSVELRDEARRYWRELAVERPDDPQLKALARE